MQKIGLKKFTKLPKLFKKTLRANPLVCGAANGEPRIGEGILYANGCIITENTIFIKCSNDKVIADLPNYTPHYLTEL